MLHTIPLDQLLAPHRGVISVIGSGGKSTLLACGGRALADAGRRVVLATSTHMFVPQDIPLASGELELEAMLSKCNLVCVGEVEQRTGKLIASAIPFSRLADMADYVLVEADGSHRLPLKAHAPHEPVIPAANARTILVVGAGAFGETVETAVHRPEIFCRLTGCSPQDAATPELVARAVAAEGLVDEDDLVILNQVDHMDRPSSLDACHDFVRALGREVLAGSIRSGALVHLG